MLFAVSCCKPSMCLEFDWLNFHVPDHSSTRQGYCELYLGQSNSSWIFLEYKHFEKQRKDDWSLLRNTSGLYEWHPQSIVFKVKFALLCVILLLPQCHVLTRLYVDSFFLRLLLFMLNNCTQDECMRPYKFVRVRTIGVFLYEHFVTSCCVCL